MEYVHAFWVGGLICAAVQILMDRTKLMPGRIMVLLVCGGAVLGFLNIYGPFQKFAGAGASVPLAILFLCMQRFYVDGVSGAVKG